MSYRVELHQVAVFFHQRPQAERIVKRVLDDRLGGSDQVLPAFQAYQAAGPNEYMAPSQNTEGTGLTAITKWRSAVDVALVAVHAELPQLVMQIAGDDLVEALAYEQITIASAPSA